MEKYLQGYHGLVKTLVDNIYYYQDELGSTSHIADATGGLIESYQYDLYGKPRVYNASGVYQPNATPIAQDLFTGQRWRSELGLYDDRNRFMSPDLGRFLQPDPIGFKGDASNLYRYCGNDWANRTDPMGTDGNNGVLGHDFADNLGTKVIDNATLEGDASGLASLNKQTSLQTNDKIGLSIGTGVTPPQQSIGQPLPSVNYVNVTLYQANPVTVPAAAGGVIPTTTTINLNHVGVGINTNSTKGFYPASTAGKARLVAGIPAKGNLKPDKQPIIASHRIPISQTQAYLGIRYQRQIKQEHDLYALSSKPGNNCVTTAEHTLNAMGIETPHDVRPNTFFNEMFGGH